MARGDRPENPFAALEKLRDALPPAAPGAPGAGSVAESASARAAAAPLVPDAPPRAVVRLERKGRAGKEVTVVEQLALAPADLEAWAFDLKKRLGCGGAVDGAAIVLQGDQRARAKARLAERGVRRISVG